VRHRGNKFRLRFLRLTNLDGHIIDGTNQLADLVVILTGDLHAVGAGGNALGRRVDLRDGHQNGLDKKAAQEEDRANKQQADRDGNQCDHQDLKIRIAQTCYIAQHADHFAVCIDHRTGNGQNALPCQRVSTLVVPDLLAVDRLLNLGRRGRTSGKFSIGGSDKLSIRRNKLQFQPVLFFKGLCKFDTGLIIFLVTL